MENNGMSIKSTSKFRIFMFNNDVKNTCVEVYKVISAETKYVEDLIILCSKELNIKPVSRHLFGIYEKNSNFWLSLNEELRNVNSNACCFEFRVRFKPHDIPNLRDIDTNAFTYYFNQIRYDFRRTKPDMKQKERVLGVVIVDISRYCLEQGITRENALSEVEWDDFLPPQYPFKKNPLLYIKSKEIKENLNIVWECSQGSSNFMKNEFMNAIAFRTPLLKDYGVEKYSAHMLSDANYNNPATLMAVEVQCDCNTDFGVFVCPFSGKRKMVCSIAELCFISVQMATNTVQISRKNGTPLSFCFSGQAYLKSFVSCLDGLYRLSENWTFNLYKGMPSPSLEVLREFKCHGPIGREFAKRKLKCDGNNKVGSYLIRECFDNYDEYLVDINVSADKIETRRIKKNAEKFFLEDSTTPYSCVSSLVKDLLMKMNLQEKECTCLRPSEFEKQKPQMLLLCRFLCRQRMNSGKTNVDSRSNWPQVIPKGELRFCRQMWKMNPNIEVSLAKLGNENVVAKVIKNANIRENFLKTLSDWVKVKSDCIIAIHGVCLHSPLALVVEYLVHGPLDAFLVTNIERLKVVELMESVVHAARALWYLEENNLVHGRIRCHNLLVSKYDSDTLKVKLSDPISDVFKAEGAWISPEGGKSTAADVWAFGTTVWEIFSYGVKPECDDVKKLNQPLACPPHVWKLIMECWNHEPHNRKQPQAIVRDVNQLFYEVYNCRQHNSYAVPDSEKPDKKAMIRNEKQNFLSYFKSNSSKTFNSTTTLPADDESRNLVDLRESDEISANTIDAETWIIPTNQLALGKHLGTGFYGEVLLATLSRWSNLSQENVAVKRIKSQENWFGGATFADMNREISIMKKLRHKNIVEIKGYVEEPQLMIVMEYLELGSLVSYLQSYKQTSNIKELIPFLKFACDIAEGMEYLESKSVIHKDLAARNILVSTPNLVKISDFGLAQCLDPNDPYYKMTFRLNVPLKWYAPEAIMHRRFSHKSDVWSYGVTLWQMYSYGIDPYDLVTVDPHNVVPNDFTPVYDSLWAGNRLSCPEECPNSVYEIMHNCWKFEPKERPNFMSLKNSIKELMK